METLRSVKSAFLGVRNVRVVAERIKSKENSPIDMAHKPVVNGQVSQSRTVALARQASLRGSIGEHSNSITEQTLGSHDQLVDYDALIRHFECPVCHEWITPPIVQCRKGHVVCGPCKSSGLKTCPVCKQRFSDVPNWMMEQVCSLPTTMIQARVSLSI